MNKKIYIIEDDLNTLLGLCAKFSLGGLDVLFSEQVTERIEEVLRDIKNIKPDYLIINVFLPKVSGINLLSTIKSDIETSRIPIFIFSEDHDVVVKDKCLNLGVDYFLPRNEFNDLDQFVIKVKKIIKNRDKIK